MKFIEAHYDLMTFIFVLCLASNDDLAFKLILVKVKKTSTSVRLHFDLGNEQNYKMSSQISECFSVFKIIKIVKIEI